MEIEKICAYCGKPFIAKSKRAKYCSSRCRVEAFQDKSRSEARSEVLAEKQAEADKWQKEREARSKQRRDELEEKAADGDPFSRMLTAKKYSPEYFEALRDYEIQFADQTGKPSSCEINGISIYSDNFPEDAAASVAEDGVCITRR